MAFKILAQAVGTGALAELYVVPTGFEAVCSTFVAVNTGATTAAVEVHAAKGGVPDTTAHVILAPIFLDPGQRLAITEGWTLGPGAKVRVNAGAAMAINLFGSENPA